MHNYKLNYFKILKKFIERGEKFFLIIFSSIPALKFHTKHYTAIALNALLCEVLLPIIKNQKSKSISHNGDFLCAWRAVDYPALRVRHIRPTPQHEPPSYAKKVLEECLLRVEITGENELYTGRFRKSPLEGNLGTVAFGFAKA